MSFLPSIHQYPPVTLFYMSIPSLPPSTPTLQPSGGGLPVHRALVQQRPPPGGQVLPTEHASVLDLAQRLGLHPAVDVPQPQRLLVEVDQRVHLDDAVLDEHQGPGQLLVLLRPRCVRWRWRAAS